MANRPFVPLTINVDFEDYSIDTPPRGYDYTQSLRDEEMRSICAVFDAAALDVETHLATGYVKTGTVAWYYLDYIARNGYFSGAQEVLCDSERKIKPIEDIIQGTVDGKPHKYYYLKPELAKAISNPLFCFIDVVFTHFKYVPELNTIAFYVPCFNGDTPLLSKIMSEIKELFKDTNRTQHIYTRPSGK